MTTTGNRDKRNNCWQRLYPCFNPRHRTGGDDRPQGHRLNGRRFQSTPPHGWRLDVVQRWSPGLDVSIHATARVATQDLLLLHRPGLVSIHATARVATPGLVQHLVVDAVSIHATARVATEFNKYAFLCKDVSIHATARVATSVPVVYEIARRLFQSTPPHGWRLQCSAHKSACMLFQSTPPHGWRRDLDEIPRP